LEEARRSVLDLRAAPLAGRTLVEALVLLAEAAPLPVDLLVTGGNQPLPPRVETGLYRIAQEAINNSCRHSQASQIIVKLVATPQSVALIVEDDGQGFDLETISSSRFGLVGLNERARLLNGRFHIESSPGQGTRVEAELPHS
jgi:two-component system NarL family sensor kinase